MRFHIASKGAVREPGGRCEMNENPTRSGVLRDGRGGFRTCDLSRVKRALSH